MTLYSLPEVVFDTDKVDAIFGRSEDLVDVEKNRKGGGEVEEWRLRCINKRNNGILTVDSNGGI